MRGAARSGPCVSPGHQAASKVGTASIRRARVGMARAASCEIVSRYRLDELAAIHDGDPVRDLAHQVEVVGDEEIGGAVSRRSSTSSSITAACTETSSDEVISSQITSAGRAGEGARDGDALLLAARELVREAVRVVRRQLHLLEHVPNGAPDRLGAGAAVESERSARISPMRWRGLSEASGCWKTICTFGGRPRPCRATLAISRPPKRVCRRTAQGQSGRGRASTCRSRTRRRCRGSRRARGRKRHRARPPCRESSRRMRPAVLDGQPADFDQALFGRRSVEDTSRRSGCGTAASSARV